MEDPTKKRKWDGIGLTAQEIRKIAEPLTHKQLLDIIHNAADSDPAALPAILKTVLSIADGDFTQRNILVNGLALETTAETLRPVFEPYGEIDAMKIIVNKGYGYITYKHIDGAILALKGPSKTVDGHVVHLRLATEAYAPIVDDNSIRKIFVWGLTATMSAVELVNHFSRFGEIEEGPIAGKSKEYALFVYKTAEGAQEALENSSHIIDGTHLRVRGLGMKYEP